MDDPIIPDVDESGQQIRQLDQSQQFAATRSPDEAANTFSYAKRAGVDFSAAEGMKQKFPWLGRDQTSWGALVKEHPVLADHLADPAFASVAKDDVHNLSAFERLFGGWDEMAWASKLALESDTRSQELASVGRAMRNGKATPEQLKRADELDKQAAAPEPKTGFVPGIVPAMVGMAPGLLRASKTALGYGAAGAAGGAAVGSVGAGVGAVPGAIGGALTMGGAGFVVGMSMDTAATEQGLAYREYVKAGADPKVAGVAADIVALANGGLQAIPAEKVLNLVPGLKGLIAGKATRDVMRRLIASNTGRAALGRFAGRVAESGLLMGLIGASQELIRETGAIQSGADTEYHGGRVWDAGVGGAQQGIGFGVGTKALPFKGDLYEAKAAENRGTLYKTLGQIATDSKLRERMPDEYKAYANAVIKKYGKVEEVKAPAEALSSLFQKEGVTNEQIQEVMPEVAKQLREAKPTDEVVIPMADLATHIAPLKGFPELSSDLRVGDELTPREAKSVVAEAEKAQADHEKMKGEIASGEDTPARKVYNEVFEKLTKAGQAPEVAQHDATLWAAFSKSRGERLGVDPYEYFSKRAVNIGTEDQGGEISLGQKDGKFKINSLKLDEQNLREAKENIARGQGSQTDGPVTLYRREGSDKLELGNGYHRLVEAMERGDNEINGKVDPETLPLFPTVNISKDKVDGLTVRGEVPNLGSISSSLDKYDVLPGIREVKLSDFEAGPEDTPRARELAEQINESKELNPLIVAKDKDGLYILEGANRFDALGVLGKKKFPAVVVVDRTAKTGITKLEQPAYHGSPYQFDKFTLDHIGSGEGAQVYGWGLYFAEEKSVAEYYKEALKQPDELNEWKLGSRYLYHNGEVADYSPRTDSPADHAWGVVAEQILIHENEIRDAYTLHGKDGVKDAMRKVIDNEIKNTDKDEWGQKLIPEFERLKKQLDNGRLFRLDIKENKSKIYQVDLPDKKNLLDYDKAISEQHPDVLAKLKKAGLVREPPKDPRELLREFLASDFAKSFSDGSEVRSAKYFLEHGDDEEINAYLDAKRKDPSAAINNTVLKDSGGTFYDRLARELGGPRAASLKLNEAGIPGLKYLDQGSRTPGGVSFYGDKPSGMHVQDPAKAVSDFTEQVSDLVKEGKPLPEAFKEAADFWQNEASKLRYAADGATERAQPHKFDDRADYHKAAMDAEGLRSQAHKAEKIAEWASTLSADDFQVDEGTHNFVVWDEKSISILDTLEQQAGEGYRGKIAFDQARSFFNITLTGKANLSTFLHESGHAFLEFMRADAANGAVDPDLAKIYEWLGVKAGEEPTVPQLETFAKGFEVYLREGKAPATGLREAFRAFGAWLKLVYKSIAGLGVHLSDDVRGVMDRMLATDKEIEEARSNLGFEPLKKPKEMSEADYTSYKERFARAVEASRDRLQEQALREFSKTIGEERNKVRGEVEEATKMDPAQNAFEALRTGKRLDGAEVPEEIKGKKLSREAVRDYPGYKDTKKWTSITSPDGVDPEVLAPYYGFKSGQEMLDALAARRTRSAAIKEETERRMRDRYPDADMGAMADQAVKAFHEEATVENVLWTEAEQTAKYMKGLEAQASEGQASLRVQKAVIRESASRRVEAMTALEMQPGRFARAEETAAAESAKAYKSGDFAKAHEEKLGQIMNHELWKRVSEAKEEIEGIRNYLDKFNELPARRRMGKAGQSYVEAIDKIISDIELKKVGTKDLARRASLESYLKNMEDEDGAILSIPDELRAETSLKNYKTMTLEELRTVRDAVKNIESMARLKNKLFDGRETREYQATAIKASEHIRANLGTPYAEKAGANQNPSWWEAKKAWLRESRAEKKKIEFIARELDGGQTAGFLHELLFQPFATAEGKAHDLGKSITEMLTKPLRELSIKERLGLDKTVDFLGTPMKMRDVISVALNMGNDGNKRKLIEGYGYRNWTEEAVVNRLGELLTDKHLDLVQHFWDTIGKLWPEIKGLSERTTGLAPPKVEPTTLTIRGRELTGGYYPVVYDRERSYKAEQIAQRKGDLWENNFLKPGVSKGFTEARTQFYAPLLLSLNVIPSHINEVVHYLTHYEATRSVDRLLAHGEIRKAITEGLGRETYNLFRPWLQAIAHDGVVPGNLTGIDNILRHLRVGAAVTRLGFRLTNSIMQGFNLLSSVKELGGVIDGPKYLSLGVKRWMEDMERFSDPFGPVSEVSPEIRGKSQKMEHELINNFDHFTSAFSEFGHMKERLGHFAMSFMSLAWRTCDTITWYAAREKAFADGHPRPLEYADSVVRMSQMGEGMKDKSALMRGGEGSKIFTNMYSWYSVIYNQLSETQPQNRSGWQKTGELASRWWWMVLAPSVAMGLARGKGPSKDRDEPASWLKYYGEEIALEAAKPWPVAGVIAETLLSDHEARFAPWISTVLKGVKARGKAMQGEKLSEGDKKAIVESTGITSHLPATAMWNAYRYVSAVQDGKLEEPVRDLLFRAPGEWK